MANKKQIQPDRQDADLVVRARQIGREESKIEIESLKGQLQVAEHIFLTTGQIQALNLTRTQADFFIIVKLKQIKESREYWEKYEMTWAQFCERCGIARATADRKINDLGDLRSDFLLTLSNLAGVDFNKIKYLGMSSGDPIPQNEESLIEMKGEDIYFAGEKIPMESGAINAVLDRLELSYKDQIKEQKKHSDKDISGLKGQIHEAVLEKKALISRIKEIEPFIVKDKDKKAVEILKAVDDALDRVDDLLRAFVVMDAQELNDDTIGKVSGILKRITDRIEMFTINWGAQLAGDGE